MGKSALTITSLKRSEKNLKAKKDRQYKKTPKSAILALLETYLNSKYMPKIEKLSIIVAKIGTAWEFWKIEKKMAASG
jgi:hypothetical protein